MYNLKSQISNLKSQISNRGFSMVELMVAVAIMGVIATAAVPSYNSFVKKGLKSSIKSDITGLQKAWLAFGFDTGDFCKGPGAGKDSYSSIYSVGYKSLFYQKRYGHTAWEKDGNAANFIGFGYHGWEHPGADKVSCRNGGGMGFRSGGGHNMLRATATEIADFDAKLKHTYAIAVNTDGGDTYNDDDCILWRREFKMGVLKKIDSDNWQVMAIDEEGVFGEKEEPIVTLTNNRPTPTPAAERIVCSVLN